MDSYYELLETIASRHLAGWNDYKDIIKNLKAARTGSYQEAEDARKRLRHPWLKTTNLRDSINSLQEPLMQVLSLWMEIELGELDLQALKDADLINAANQKCRKETGLYSEARSFFDMLHDDYDVSSPHFANLSEGSVKAIAAICLGAHIIVEKADGTVIHIDNDQP
jgi:5'-deoxynucleotidase YfbR-like HD superfamily hydrolase